MLGKYINNVISDLQPTMYQRSDGRRPGGLTGDSSFLGQQDIIAVTREQGDIEDHQILRFIINAMKAIAWIDDVKNEKKNLSIIKEII